MRRNESPIRRVKIPHSRKSHQGKSCSAAVTVIMVPSGSAIPVSPLENKQTGYINYPFHSPTVTGIITGFKGNDGEPKRHPPGISSVWYQECLKAITENLKAFALRVHGPEKTLAIRHPVRQMLMQRPL
jgi:hypothetical protein